MLPFRSLVPLLLLLPVAACAGARGTFEPLGPGHPADARSPELPIVDPSAVLRSQGDGALPAAAGASTAESGGQAAGAYVCPMHAEVSADQPGACPKCGMALVPRAASKSENEEHRHER